MHPFSLSKKKIIINSNLEASSFYITLLQKKTEKKFFIIVDSRENAEKLEFLIKNFNKQINVKYYNLQKFFPFSKILREKSYVPEILEMLYDLLLERRDIIIVPFSIILKKFVESKILAKESINLKVNEEIDREALIMQLIEWGYERESFVSLKGEFSVRGDLVDIFIPIYNNPVRISFFGDYVESINFFNSMTQRRFKDELKTIDIVSCTEVKNETGDYKILPAVKGIKTSSIFNYIGDNYIKVIYSKEKILKKINDYKQDLEDHFKNLEINYDDVFIDSDIIKEQLNNSNIIFSEITNSENFIDMKTYSYNNFYKRLKGSFKPLIDEVLNNIFNKRSIFLILHNELKYNHIENLLKENQIDFVTLQEESIIESYLKKPGKIFLKKGDLFNGFSSEFLNVSVINEKDIYGKKLKRAKFRVDENLKIRNFSEIKEGDFIVHLQHGIGIFKGLKNLKFGESKKDFFIIEYSGGDKLYVPIDKTNMLQKYIGKDGYVPVIDKLGSKRWQTLKEKVKLATEAIAKDILNLYAKRKLLKGVSFKCDEELIDEFARNWEFEETDDQVRSIEEVYNDMDSETPMDRLLCGDVGYGKTEVAIRAILKAILCGYQAAFLVPTTVLAMQHYDVLTKRFKDYPFIIKKLTRFESKKEQREIINDLKEGKVDIIIGTHRILQDDVEFKKLGLLIIDEEHKFGVKHKERIKMLKSNIDVLYMTATPIPRTLQLSLLGIKDLSVIETPPIDRKSIETKIIRFDKDIIRNAILKELNRGGQVFFIHNAVKSIYNMANFLKKIVPEAEICVAHGQMKENELEKIIKDFIEKRYNVLICTTIIESGIDMPNVNTIIINRADKFGLSQLYQLRGRVGRSDKKAYAYLIIPDSDIIAEKAVKRLRVIQQYSNLSEGLKIAMNDLELRGAGNLFGVEQSGKVLSVGYEFFLEALEDAIKKLKGEKIEEKVDPEITVSFSFYIPDKYIEDEKERFYFYKKLSLCENFNDVEEIEKELYDRFGRLPDEVKNLLNVIRYKVVLKELKVEKAKILKGYAELKINEKSKISSEKIVQLINQNRAKLIEKNVLKIIFLSENIFDQLNELKLLKEED